MGGWEGGTGGGLADSYQFKFTVASEYNKCKTITGDREGAADKEHREMSWVKSCSG